MKRLFAFAAAILVSTAAFAQQQDFSKVEIKVQKVQGTVYMLTGAGAVIFFKTSDVGHMADDLFFAQFPFVDLDNGGSVRGLIKNLDAIMPMIDDDTKLIAGHGALSDKKALNEWINMLKGTVAIMNEAIQKGK